MNVLRMSIILACAFCSGCLPSVPENSLPGVYTNIDLPGGYILELKPDGTQEEALIKTCDGTVQRTTGTWKYHKGVLEIRDCFEPLLRAGSGWDASSCEDVGLFSAWEKHPVVNRGFHEIPLHPDLAEALVKRSPTLPRAVRTSWFEALPLTADSEEMLCGGYISATGIGFDVLRLAKDGVYTYHRLCYPSQHEIHWRGVWSIEDSEDNVSIAAPSLLSSSGATKEEMEPPKSAKFSMTTDSHGTYLFNADSVFFNGRAGGSWAGY